MALLSDAVCGKLAQPASVHTMGQSAKTNPCQVHPEHGVLSQSIDSGISYAEWNSTKIQDIRQCVTFKMR